MKRPTLYKIGAGVVGALIIVISVVTCSGASSAALTNTSLCSDWNGNSNDNAYAASASQETGSDLTSFIDQVNQICTANPGSNLTGVMSAVSVEQLGGN